MKNHAGILNKEKFLYILLGCVVFLMLFAITGMGSLKARADRLFPSFYSTDGSGCADISDGDYFTTEYFDPGTEVTISSEQQIESIYVVWENYPGPWTLTVNGKDYTYGKDGYLHEFIKLPQSADSVTLSVGDSRITIADIYAFSAGTLPDFVQQWEPSYDQADVLFISTHADDEVLFFGGLIPNYIDRGDVRVQVAYFSDLFQSEPYRNHEILNGLWKMGVTHYPQLGEFYDNYSESYEEASGQFNYNDGLEYIVKTIRRFKPQVVVGQDMVNGEYGHGGHMWCARLIADAVEVTADEETFPESADLYGTWDVAKTYFHLYPDNPIEANARIPLAKFGGKTALQVAKEAYLEHQSQQWTWFYVSDGYDDDGNPDGYEYSCTKYGLYRTTVGDDFTGSDIMDNIVTYDEQARKAAQEAAEKAALEAPETTVSEGENDESTTAKSVVNENNITAVPGGKNTTALTIFVVLAIIVVIIIAGIIVVSRARAKERARKKALKKRQMAARNANNARSASGARSGAVRPARVQSRNTSAASRTPVSRTSASRASASRPQSQSGSRTQSRSSAAQSGSPRRSSNGTYSSGRSGRR